MWVARDKNGKLNLFVEEPPVRYNENGCWLCEAYDMFGVHEIDSNLFPDLMWEDDAIEVELKEK